MRIEPRAQGYESAIADGLAASRYIHSVMRTHLHWTLVLAYTSKNECNQKIVVWKQKLQRGRYDN